MTKQTDLNIEILSHSQMRILTEPGHEEEICEKFSFMAEGYKYMPSYKQGRWDGKIELFNRRTKCLSLGLLPRLLVHALDNNYTYNIEDEAIGNFLEHRNEIPVEEFVEWVGTLDLPFEPRDYQYTAAYKAIVNRRILLLSPTGSGKSFIMYLILRWYMDHEDEKPALVVVPTTSLVEQLFKDFKDYGFPDVEENIHIIYAGKDKDTQKPVVISTWQSIYKLPVSWFANFGIIFGDEAHTFKSTSLKTVMNKCVFAPYRIGTTGTLDGIKVHKLILEGLFGPIEKVTTTKKLQESNELAQLDIRMMLLDYPEEHRKLMQKLHKKKYAGGKTSNKYYNEIEFICGDPERNKLISDLATNLKGNTLILYRFVEMHGDRLYEEISQSYPDHSLHYIHGGTETAIREEIRQIVEHANESTIILASIGTFSQGINIKNIHNIIFASPSKGIVRVLQSIGRGLRLADNGWHTTLYDLVDDYSIDGFENYSLKHGRVRTGIYDKEEFNVKIHRIKMYAG
jgi:superfamily II DNA or RNA helicase